MLELRGVAKHFGDTIALQPTDLIAASGSTMVLIGPSGCGKSTLLRLMLGLIQPDAGSVAIDGTILAEQNLDTLRHRIGYVIQDGGLFPHLRAGENVSLLARHLDWTPDRIHTRLRELAELTHFPVDALDRYPAQLSGGQRQRVAIAAALIRKPVVLILDEATSSLDTQSEKAIQDAMKELQRQGATTIFIIAHRLSTIREADIIMVLDEGKLVQMGSHDELLKEESGLYTKMVGVQTV